MLYWLATSKVPSGNGFLNTSYRMISLLHQDDKSIRCIETLLSVHPHLSKVLDISLHQESGVWPRYPSVAKPLWLFLSENAFVAGNLVFWLLQHLLSLKYETSFPSQKLKHRTLTCSPKISLSGRDKSQHNRGSPDGVLLPQFASRLVVHLLTQCLSLSAKRAR